MRVLVVYALLSAPAAAPAQPAPPAMTRTAAVDPSSKIAYVLISLAGKPVPPAEQPASPPRLTAQCTRDPSGKLKFELLADFGGISELTFQTPWKPSPGDLYPPSLPKVPVTMQFLGYTRVRPVKRNWEALDTPSGELRYFTPGLRSPNMEQIMFYLQYLRALPTLRLTAPNRGSAEFETAPWQQTIHAEPLCRAGGL